MKNKTAKYFIANSNHNEYVWCVESTVGLGTRQLPFYEKRIIECQDIYSKSKY